MKGCVRRTERHPSFARRHNDSTDLLQGRHEVFEETVACAVDQVARAWRNDSIFRSASWRKAMNCGRVSVFVLVSEPSWSCLVSILVVLLESLP